MMQEFKDVHGDQDHVDGVEFNVDTIYVRTNIRKGETCWIYNEIQYTYNEYLALLDKKVEKSETEQNTKIKDLEELNVAQDDMLFEQSYEIAMLKLNSANAV